MFTRRRVIIYGLLALTALFFWSITITTPPKKVQKPTEISKLFTSSHIITGKVVHLSMAEEDCQLDPTHPTDKMMIESLNNSLANNDKSLLQFTNCQELNKWRQGTQKYLNHIGNYQTARRLEDISVRGQEAITLKQICDNYKKQGAAPLHHDKKLRENLLKEGLKALPVNNIKMLGVVHISETLCIIASYQRLSREGQSTVNQIILLGLSILNNRLIYTYLLAPYTTSEEAEKLLDKMRLLDKTNQSRNNTPLKSDKKQKLRQNIEQ